MVLVEVNETSYSINDRLFKVWDKLRNGEIVKKDEDRVYIVDGRERSGKSVFAIQQAAFVDPTFNISRICFTADEFLKCIREAEKGQAIIFDEAFRGLSSRSALSKINKTIIQALMEMGQRNLFVFIVLPSFFLLDIYPAMLRSNALFHIYRNSEDKRGFYKVYNFSKKAKLYQTGLKKGWSYKIPSTRFRGRFSNKYPIDERAYRLKKDHSLKTMDVVKEEDSGGRSLKKYHDAIIAFHEEIGGTEARTVELLAKHGIQMTRNNLNMIRHKREKE